MDSPSISRLTDFRTETACEYDSSLLCSAINGNAHHSLQDFDSSMYPFHPSYPAGAEPYSALNSAGKPFFHGTCMRGIQSRGRPNYRKIEGSFFGTSFSPVDQISSVNYHHGKQAAISHKAPLTAINSQQGGEPHVIGAKKRIRAVMGCKDSPGPDTDAKKRAKTHIDEASDQQNIDCSVTEVKPAIINAEKAKRHNNPVLKQISTSEQKSLQSKSNVTEASSLTQDQSSSPKLDYIHVRARRGQATDSHSLAERVRREKISERMKYLQDLVPSCIKVTGKAMMLDEIINYVQSLQRQVEFLSMKLAAVPPSRLEFDELFSKKAVQPNVVTKVLGSNSAIVTPAAHLLSPTDYPSNTEQSGCFHNTVRSNEILPNGGCSLAARSGMQLQTPLNHEISVTFGRADQFFADPPCDLGVDDPLMHQNADSSSCNLSASSMDAMPNHPDHQFCIPQGSCQAEPEWDEDLQNILQKMGSFNAPVDSSWLPSDNLLSEGFFLQGIAKEEL